MMEEPKITLDASTFKALASGTRVNILKTLEKRRHTQSELAAVLTVSIPTIKEHLLAMERAGLVKRNEEGRKWIYYSLTEKAKCVLDPERKRLWIVLGFFLLSAVGAVVAISRYFSQSVLQAGSVFAEGAPRLMAAKTAAFDAAEEAVAGVAEESLLQSTAADASLEAVNVITTSTPLTNYLPYIMTFFIIVSLVLLVLSIYYLKKSRVLRK